VEGDVQAWVKGQHLPLAELCVSNEHIGDKAALDRAWDRDGYLFFRGVLDRDAVTRLRAVYIEEIKKLGGIDAGEREARYNGQSLERVPKFPAGIQGLFDRAPWKEFVADTRVHDFIASLLGSEPHWVPIVGYRVQAPQEDPTKDRFAYVHQDGFFNPGIPFRNCWIPLVDMDEDIGGLAVAEGCHKSLHHDTQTPPIFPVPAGSIPLSAWRRANYAAGDLLVLHLDAPHTGITNLSPDRFRLSLDIRMLPGTEVVPAIGAVQSISAGHVTIRTLEGDLLSFRINEHTYCRALGPERLTPAQIPLTIKPGKEVIVASRDGVATVVRPASY
jgi:ectoine hydroxylase-related dioxygenase (phytanoyl-CoA dioxygenase family)